MTAMPPSVPRVSDTGKVGLNALVVRVGRTAAEPAGATPRPSAFSELLLSPRASAASAPAMEDAVQSTGQTAVDGHPTRVDNVLQGPGTWAAKMEFLSCRSGSLSRSVIAASAPELGGRNEMNSESSPSPGPKTARSLSGRPKREPVVVTVPKGYPGWANYFDPLEAQNEPEPSPSCWGFQGMKGAARSARKDGKDRKAGGQGAEGKSPRVGGRTEGAVEGLMQQLMPAKKAKEPWQS